MEQAPQHGKDREPTGDNYALFAWIGKGKPTCEIVAIAVRVGSNKAAEIVKTTASNEHDALMAAAALSGQLAVAIRSRGDRVAEVKMVDEPPPHILLP